MSSSTSNTIKPCKALISQGHRKNLRCERESTENGFCVYHQRNYAYEKALQDGKQVCGMFFRGCDNELTLEDVKEEYKNCQVCRKKKSQKDHPCEYAGCVFMIEDKEQKYCKKHVRQHLRDNERITSIKYCDIERGCFEPILSGNKCEKCKQKERDGLAEEIEKLRKQYNIYLPPPKEDREQHPDIYEYQETTLICASELWREVQRGAYIRNILFILSQQDFEKLAIQTCHYCGFYSTIRLNGIDRVDNNKGYIPENCLPCCKVCNLMKGSQHPLEFLTKVKAICDYTEKGIPLDGESLNQWKDSYCSRVSRMTYTAYENNTKLRNMDFLLSEAQYHELLQGNCYLCGIENKNGHENGIDRMDSTPCAYEYDNCRSCCGHCNIMKHTFTYTQFIQKCKQITAHCTRHDSFQNIPRYHMVRCRKESYKAEEIAHMMKNGAYSAYIEWCREHKRSPDFIDAMNQLQHMNPVTFATHEAFVDAIRSELDKERSRKKSDDEFLEMKTMHSRTVYAYLTQGKEDYFVKWYEAHHTKSTLFDEKLRDLMGRLPELSHADGVVACQKFMYDEKNRRVIQQRRENQKKVVKYIAPVSEEKEEEKMSSPTPAPTPSPTPAPTPSPTPAPPISMKMKRPTAPTKKEQEKTPVDQVVQTVIEIQQHVGYQKKTTEDLKQWKAKQIHHAFQTGTEHAYKLHCEENNDLSLVPTWSDDWDRFSRSVCGLPEADALPLITAFVENLRRIRHNQLCFQKNASIVDKEGRQQWPATTVVRAFLDGKLDKFKAFTETSTDETPTDTKWVKRWNDFVASLEAARDNPEVMKGLCTKFMTAQRTKKYRHGKSAATKA